MCTDAEIVKDFQIRFNFDRKSVALVYQIFAPLNFFSSLVEVWNPRASENIRNWKSNLILWKTIYIYGSKFNYFFRLNFFCVFYKLTIIFLIHYSDNNPSTAAGNLPDRISDALTQQHRFTEGIKIIWGKSKLNSALTFLISNRFLLPIL